jgi:hypothetical protein
MDNKAVVDLGLYLIENCSDDEVSILGKGRRHKKIEIVVYKYF